MILMNQIMACCGVEPAASGGGSSWWLADGAIAESDVLAAFDPKIAGTLAESMVNLINPGVYDLEDIDGDLPTLDPGVGWLFTNEQWMRFPLMLDVDVSVVARWSGIAGDQEDEFVLGLYNDYHDRFFAISPGYNHFSYGWERTMISLGGMKDEVAESAHTAAGTVVLVNSETDSYSRGFLNSSITSSGLSVDQSTREMYVGGARGRNGPENKQEGLNGHITHFAVYNTALTDAQAEAIRAHVDSL